jgi:hypothetical protein
MSRCDCALVHRLDFNISEEHGLEMLVYGDAAAKLHRNRKVVQS